MRENKLVPKRRFKGFNEEWDLIELGSIVDYEQPTKYIVMTETYNERFKTPVLTAGQSFILGYTNETVGIKNANVDKPVIIFDDFTTGTHFVDFPFKVKSSALKILIPNLNQLDSHFVYHAIKNIKYIPENHERHWISIFSKFEIRKPHLKEQRKIGRFFQLLDQRIDNQTKKIAKLKNLKSAYLSEMFPQEGETVPKRRFKGFDGEWDLIELGSVVDYEQPTKYIVMTETYNERFKTPVLTAGQSFILGYTNETVGIKKANVDKPVIIFDDFTTGTHFVDFPFKVKSSALKILTPNLNQLDSHFVYHAIKNIKYIPENHERHWISIFSKFEIRKPHLKEQQKIGLFFKNLDDQIETEKGKLAKLKTMKDAYLEEMFV